MFLWLWNYIRGYVNIEVTGFSVDRFINLAVHKGIYLWDIEYRESGMLMKVSIDGFKMLRTCAKKTKCRVKIVSKLGYPFVMHRYRKRKILLGGAVFFIIFLYIFSSFYWLIDVKGNERLKKEDIIEFCKTEGLRQGVLRYKVDIKILERKLLNAFPDIGWINIHVKGTQAVVNIAEIIPKQPIIDNSVPCDIIAKKDGLITSMATSSGTPLVRQKDVVKKGDVLVSGELTVVKNNAEVITEYVHARSEVFAKEFYEIILTIPFSYTEKQYTQKIKKRYSIIIFNKNINLYFSRISFVNYDKITNETQLRAGADYPMPVRIKSEEYREFVPIEKMRTQDQIKELADKMITGRMRREMELTWDITDKTYEYEETTDGMAVRAFVTTNERIDEERVIAY